MTGITIGGCYEQSMEEIMDTPLSQLEWWGISVRVLELLERGEFIRVGDLVGVTPDILRLIPGMGPCLIEQVADALRRFLLGNPPIVPLPAEDRGFYYDDLDYAA